MIIDIPIYYLLFPHLTYESPLVTGLISDLIHDARIDDRV